MNDGSNQEETKAILQCLDKLRDIQAIVPAKQDGPSPQEEPENRLIDLLRGEWINAVTGYFANHRPNYPYALVDDEYKVQDLIYCLAATLLPDLQFENPQSKTVGAVTYTRVDFSSAKERLFIEAKFANDRHDAKKVDKEISEDIFKYGKNGTFEILIFFVYCHNYTFPNQRDFERRFTGLKNIDGNSFRTYCIVKP